MGELALLAQCSWAVPFSGAGHPFWRLFFILPFLTSLVGLKFVPPVKKRVG
jgi:hypothetical protein